MNYIIIFLISMIPLAELRVAIPTGIAMGVSVLPAYAICILGNLLPMPFVYLFSHRLLEWGKNKKVIGKFFGFCIEKGKSAGQKLQDTAGRGLFIALVLFIGIPIPGTGAASILRMDFKKSIMACLCGIMLAGVIMAISSIGVLNLLDIN